MLLGREVASAQLSKNMDETTAKWISVILQASPGQFKHMRLLNELCQTEHDHPLSIRMIFQMLLITAIEALTELSLSPNSQRDEKLATFTLTITQPRIEWIEVVKATSWDTFNWSSEASHLFTHAVSLGISGTVAFAVVASAMSLQGFKVPSDLNRRLHGAKTSFQRQVKELAEAEKRRTAELATMSNFTSPGHVTT